MLMRHIRNYIKSASKILYMYVEDLPHFLATSSTGTGKVSVLL